MNVAIPLEILDSSVPYFALLVVRKQNKYKKGHTYEHILQIFLTSFSSSSSSSFNLEDFLGLGPVP